MSTHEDIGREMEIEGSSDRSFGIVFCIFFAVVGLWPLLFGNAFRLWALALSAGFLLVALAYPRILAPLNRLWFLFGILLGKIVQPIVLGIIFFVVMTPMALAIRVLKVDLLKMKYDPDADSYWEKRSPPGPEPSHMSRQF